MITSKKLKKKELQRIYLDFEINIATRIFWALWQGSLKHDLEQQYGGSVLCTKEAFKY